VTFIELEHEAHKIRNPKHETNPNDQNGSYGLPTLRAGPRFQMTKTEQTYIGFKVLFATLGNSDFEFVSDFSF
jgi:hypothetical protein